MKFKLSLIKYKSWIVDNARMIYRNVKIKSNEMNGKWIKTNAFLHDEISLDLIDM